MQSARIDSKDGLDPAWSGVRSAGAVPVCSAQGRATDCLRESTHDLPLPRASRARIALRIMRNAAIGLALLSTIPMGLVASRRESFIFEMSHLVTRTAEADRWREFRAPIDASTTPQAAGAALRRITTLPERDNYTLRAQTTTHARPWSSITLAPDLFPAMRTPQYQGPAASMLIENAPGGYSASEVAYLRDVAAAPFWKDFDAVALADVVDVVGGLYETPFTAEAQLMAFPTVRFTEAKQTAYAAVSRAAFYLASGNPAEAERVLRTIVSFGFIFIDQGVTSLDAMVGRMIVDVGRDGLYQLYLNTGRGELAARLAPLPQVVKRTARSSAAPIDLELARARALALVNDVRAPRPLRIGALEMLSYGGSCGSVRAMLTGPSAELRSALSSARTSIARYPSEQSLFDLIERTMQDGPQVERSADVMGRVASGTASVLSAITGNPRIATCTRLATTMSTK